jgi:membrane-bound inhibitor of C-type lysozyme
MRFVIVIALGLITGACASNPDPMPTAEQELLRYVCAGGVSFTLSQRDQGAWAVLASTDQRAPVQLRAARTGSGFAYVGPGLRFHGKGNEALLTREGRADLSCKLDGEG